MPRGPQGQKRPADVIGNAVRVMRIATGEETEEVDPVKSAAAELEVAGKGACWKTHFGAAFCNSASSGEGSLASLAGAGRAITGSLVCNSSFSHLSVFRGCALSSIHMNVSQSSDTRMRVITAYKCWAKAGMSYIVGK